jgi:hypothetical protein
VPTGEVAYTILGQWLNAWQKHEVSPYAQDVRPVENPEEDLIEIIKYETKIFTDPEPGKGKKKKRTYKIYIRALDTIYGALKGKHLVESIGLKVPKVEKKKEQSRWVDDYEIWQYHTASGDWLHEEHESVLANYEPYYELCHILENHIDTKTG